MGTKTTALKVLIGTVLINFVASEFKRVCYYTNWAQYRSGVGKYFPEDIDPDLCTHIIYSFAKLDNNLLKHYEWNDEDTPWSQGMYSKTIAMKQKNPKLKILIAVGGWNHENTVPKFSNMVTSDSTLDDFVAHSIDFLRERGFDGLDLDWEYPSVRPEGRARPSDKARFTLLCQRLREAYEEEAKSSGKPRLLLTAAVAAGESTTNSAYQVAEIAKYLDFINLMAYDLNGGWRDVTGHNSPLYPRDSEKGDDRKLNQDWAVNNWLAKGTPKEKLILGLATYGRSFKLTSSDTGMGSPAKGGGNAGSFTKEKGFLSYYEICQKLNQGWTSVWHDQHEVPYAYNGDQWVGYDNVRSISIKSKYIVNNQLGGGMIWALDLDDFNGQTCNEGKYPLISAMKEILTEADKRAPAPQPTRAPWTPAPLTSAPWTPAPWTPAPKIPDSNDDSGYGDPKTDVATSDSNLKMVCYYTFWAKYRKNASFVPADIDPKLCTHIMYSFGQIKGNSIVPYNEDPSLNDDMMKVLDIRQRDPNIKVLLSLGGGTHDRKERRFSKMVATNASVNEFASNAIGYLRDHGFDGLDLDWEYPAFAPMKRSDKQRFTVLCEILRKAFNREAAERNTKPLLLTAAVAVGKTKIDKSYEVDKIAEHLDFINIMAYNFHGVWDRKTGLHSPLYARSDEKNYQRTLNSDWVVKYWKEKGAPKEKLVLGFPTYGRSFTLSDTSNYGVNAPIRGVGKSQYIKNGGLMPYFEVCSNLKFNGWSMEWQDEHKVPYAYKGDQWVGYDDIRSIEIKANYIVNEGLGGALVWALDLDDFKNWCGDGKYPLLQKMKDVLISPRKSADVPNSGPQAPKKQCKKKNKKCKKKPAAKPTAPKKQCKKKPGATPKPTNKKKCGLKSKAKTTTVKPAVWGIPTTARPTTTRRTTTRRTTTRRTTTRRTPRPTAAARQTTKAPTTSCKPAPPRRCPRQWLKDNCKCNMRYHCVNNFPRIGKTTLFARPCPGATVFVEARQNCVWPFQVKSGPCAP